MRLALPEMVRDRRGLYRVKVPAPQFAKYKFRWVSTGEVDRAKAIAVLLEFGIDRIVHLANGAMLTAQTISVATLGAHGNCRDLFDLWKERVGRAMSARTAETYGMNLVSFFDGLQCWDKPIAWVDEKMIDRWVNDGVATMATASGRLSACRSLFRYAQGKGALLGNPADLVALNHRNMSLRQLEKRKCVPFTEAEYQALVRGLKDHWRDWTILAYCCGYRMTDCACLEWDSIKADSIVVYPKKKRRATRLEVPLADPLIGRAELLELCARLRTMPRRHPVYVWPEHFEGLMSPRRCSYSLKFATFVKKLGFRQAGAMKSFHSLRRSFAVRLKAEGRTLESIGALMAHANTATTEIYTDSAKNLA